MKKSPSAVAIFAESDLDLGTMRHAKIQFEKLGIHHSIRVIGPASTPDEELLRHVRTAEAEAAVFIAGSSDGIGLACKVARMTTAPVFGVPIVSGQVKCVDRFLQSFADMPPGAATFAIGRPGAINAALFAATILSPPGSEVRERLLAMREQQKIRVRAMKLPSQEDHD